MKNYLLSRWRAILSATNHQLFLVMRTTAILLLLGTMHLSATTMSQTITLNVRKAGLKQVFTTIEKQTGYAVLYSDEAIAGIAPIDVSASKMPLETFLNNVLVPVNLSYRIDGTSIFIKLDGRPLKAKASVPIPIAAPQRIVNGRVTDESQQPLDGVTVTVKGTTAVTTTDASGSYQVQVPEGGAVLVFTNIGYKVSEVPIANRQRVDVTLAVAVSDLDEVVVVGYGTTKRQDLTGSVASVSAAQFKDLAVSRIDQALLGKVAGVQVKTATGEPGAAPQIRVRGIGSISAGVTPLYVVDGFPTDNIETLNPNDIESLDILKDASATAIYGSRGSNGVIIVNTKRGKAGKLMLNFDSYYGVQHILKKPEMKNSIEQAQFFLDGMRNANLDRGNDVSGDPTKWGSPVPQVIMDVLEGRNTTDEDALDGILQAAPQQQYQLSASGGSENVRFTLSGEYMKQDGIIVNSGFERYSFRTNIDGKINDRLTLKANFNPSFTNKRALPSTGVCCLGSGIVAAAMNIHNFRPLRDANGNFTNYDGLSDMAAVYNPLAVAMETQVGQRRLRLLGNLSAEYRITDDLSFNVLLGGNFNNDKGFIFRPSQPYFFNEPAAGSDDAEMNVNWLNEYLLNYSKSFGDKHHFTAVAGYTIQQEWGELNFLTSDRFPNNLVPTLNAVSGIFTGGGSERYEWSILSYLGRVNYNFLSKYYLTASIRTDGSSRFGRDNKYGLFPSFALAWRLSDENFLKSLAFLNDWKMRVSYGETGNNNIGNYAHLATIRYEKYAFGGNAVGGFSLNNLANPSLTWEKQRSANIGTDISLFDRRLNVVIDYFRSQNTNLLLNVAIPGTTGFSNALQNIGKVQNTGWEFVVNSQNLRGRLQWSTDFNVSMYRNKVLELGPGGDPIYSGNNVTMIGKPIGMFFGFLTDGIFMNAEELSQGPIFNPGGAAQTRAGDIRFVDMNGDNIINSADNTIMGSPYPDFYYGMTNNLMYGNVSLSVSLQGSQGGHIYNMSRDGGNSGRARVRGYAFSNDYWHSEAQPGDGLTPRPNDVPTGGRRLPSQALLDEASFLRINNITLSYTFADRIFQKIQANSLRVYASANNPFIFTKNTAFNPDVSMNENPLQPGVESNNYPLPKSFILGINLAF